MPVATRLLLVGQALLWNSPWTACQRRLAGACKHFINTSLPQITLGFREGKTVHWEWLHFNVGRSAARLANSYLWHAGLTQVHPPVHRIGTSVGTSEVLIIFPTLTGSDFWDDQTLLNPRWQGSTLAYTLMLPLNVCLSCGHDCQIWFWDYHFS